MRIYLLLVALCLGGLVQAQFTSQKVLVEVGTGTWCSACPIAVAMIDKMQEQGFEIAVVKYHNNDPYENEASMERINYYNINAYPTMFIDGVQVSPYNSYPQAKILYEDATAKDREFSISVKSNWKSENTLTVKVTIEKTQHVSDEGLKLFMAVTESEISHIWHGQSEVDFAERAMIPDQNGQSLAFNEAQHLQFEFDVEMNPSWKIENLEFVTFIQNDLTKRIEQATYFTTNQVGIEERTVAKQVSVFPNPAKDYIFMDTGDSLPIEVSLYNIFGQEVLHLNNTEGKIDVSHLKSGLYLLQGVHENRSFSEKIILKK